MAKRPRNPDVNVLAKFIVDTATGVSAGKAEAKVAAPEKNPSAVALGRLGGSKGGTARAKKLTAEERSQIARNAALARWGKRG